MRNKERHKSQYCETYGRRRSLFAELKFKADGLCKVKSNIQKIYWLYICHSVLYVIIYIVTISNVFSLIVLQ